MKNQHSGICRRSGRVGPMLPSWLLAFCLLWAASVQAAAPHNFADLYDDATLRYWQPGFQRDLIWNFENAVLPYLPPDAKKRLRDVKIELPLRGKEADVFEFYHHDDKVIMPVLSMRFFADLSLAYAWLVENEYNVATVQQYVGMIHYRSARDFPGSRFPQPLDALQIPTDARNNTRVKDIFGKTFTNAMIFMLCHELGHIYHGHRGYNDVSYEQARADEAEADRFALEIMRATGTPPAGASFWFLTAASVEPHRVYYDNDKEWESQLRTRTHPMTADRMQSLAAAMNKAAPDFAQIQNDPEKSRITVQSIVGEISKVALILKDDELYQVYRRQSAGTTVEMLAPRRGIAFEVDAGPHEQFAQMPFSGVYHCEIWSKDFPVPLRLEILLRRTGDKVTGDYSYSGVTGTLKGNVTGITLEFEWTEANMSGKGTFDSSKDEKDGKSFTGGWGSGDSKDSGGQWSAKRVDPGGTRR